MNRPMTRRDALRGLLALGLVAPSSALFAPAQRAAAQGWPPVWFWDTWRPKRLNPTIWLKSDVGLYQESTFATPATLDADPVGGWQDQSGKNSNVIQATSSKRASLKLAIQNGRNIVRFDGVDDFLQSAAFASALVQPYSIWLVYKIFTTTTLHSVMDGRTGGRLVVAVFPANTWDIYAGTADIGIGASNTNWNLLQLQPNGASSTYLFNGATTPTTVSATPGTNSLTGLTLATAFDGTQVGQLDVGEVFACPGAVNALDAARMRTYLNQRWAVF